MNSNDAQQQQQRKMVRRNAMLPNSQEAINLRRFCLTFRQQNNESSTQPTNVSTSQVTSSRHSIGPYTSNVMNNDDLYSSDSSVEIRVRLGHIALVSSKDNKPYGAPSA